MRFPAACRCGATSCTEDCSSTAAHSRPKKQPRPCELEHDEPHADQGLQRARDALTSLDISSRAMSFLMMAF